MIYLEVADVATYLSNPNAYGTVDHVLTDPPYPEHVQGTGKMFATTKGKVAKNVEAPFAALDSLAFVSPLVAMARRWSLFHCALESLGDYRACDPRWIRSCIYSKDRAQPQLTADRPGSKCEGMALFHGSDVEKAWNNGGTHNVFYATPENRSKLKHPTGKPLMLCMSIVSAFTLPGETVFDPFCGSGSYALACYALGRHYYGSDISLEYVQAAREKLAAFDVAAALAAYEKHADKARWIREEPQL